jgi:preprotein translocase subunit SecE
MFKFRNYIEESVNELVHKVSWPSWEELQESSVVVMVASILIALLIFLMDFIFGISDSGFWKGLLGFYYGMFTNP